MTVLVSVLSIGDELLRGTHPDLNAPFLLERLTRLGATTVATRLVRDDLDPLTEAAQELAERSDLVISTGGLGPTLDDVTREAAARAAGVDLVEAPGVFDRLAQRFRERGLEVPEANRRQALLPRGGELLENDFGTAPGFCVRTRAGALWIGLPGPPRELQGMWGERVERHLLARFPGLTEPLERTFTLGGISESSFADRCGPWMERSADPKLGVSAKEGVLVAHLVAAEADDAGAAARLDQRAGEFAERFARWILFEGRASLAEHLVERFAVRGRTLALAESCTGGGIAKAVTDVAGSSRVLVGGWVVYSNAMKQRELGVPPELLERQGAVSPEVAACLAREAAAEAGADVAVSVTGIAGPGGGSAEKPVGLVHFGVRAEGRTFTLERRFPGGDRGRVRTFSVRTGLDLALRAVEGRLEDLPVVPAP